MKRFIYLASLTLLLAQATSASAQVTTFYGDSNAFPRDLTVPLATEASFISFLGASGTNNFDSYVPFLPPPGSMSFPGLPTTFSTDATFVGIDTQQQGSFSVSAPQFLSSSLILDPNGQPIGANLVTSFFFSDRINAFGAFFVNVGDLSNSNVLSITLQDGVAGTPRNFLINSGTPFQGRSFDATFYYGIHDAVPFDRVFINATSNQEGYIFDNITINAVPEPTTYALIAAIGLAGYATHRYRRIRLKKMAELSLKAAK